MARRPRETLEGFQFHEGTIGTLINRSTPITLINFNSMKVRLEPVGVDKQAAMARVFQFHEGTIGTLATIIYAIPSM